MVWIPRSDPTRSSESLCREISVVKTHHERTFDNQEGDVHSTRIQWRKSRNISQRSYQGNRHKISSRWRTKEWNDHSITFKLSPRRSRNRGNKSSRRQRRTMEQMVAHMQDLMQGIIIKSIPWIRDWLGVEWDDLGCVDFICREHESILCTSEWLFDLL